MKADGQFMEFNQGARSLHERATTSLVGCCLLLAAFRMGPVFPVQALLAAFGAFFVAGGIFGSVRSLLPGRGLAVKLDRAIFALSGAARALDEIAARWRTF